MGNNINSEYNLKWPKSNVLVSSNIYFMFYE